jgi:hypothetical protein
MTVVQIKYKKPSYPVRYGTGTHFIKLYPYNLFDNPTSNLHIYYLHKLNLTPKESKLHGKQINVTKLNATQSNATQRNATQRNAKQRNATQRKATQSKSTQRNAGDLAATPGQTTQSNKA